jgi:hypothetical protein
VSGCGGRGGVRGGGGEREWEDIAATDLEGGVCGVVGVREVGRGERRG